MDLKPGDRLVEERFCIEAALGRGAMGVVFRAHDTRLGRPVALKTLQLAGAEHVYELKREFRRLAGLSHRNLVELYELFAPGEACFFTMELLDGRSLVGRFADPSGKPPTWDERALADLRRCLRQLAEGLEALHAARHVHRDVKPSNVMVTTDDRVVLLDFGLAARLEEIAREEAAGRFYGTMAYAAPELAWGQPADTAADWYGVGVTLFETLTGRLPFASSPAGLLTPAPLRRAVRVSELVPEIPEAIAELVARLLDPRPERRAGYVELLELLDAGGRPGAGRSLAAPVPLTRAARLFVGRQAELAALHDAFAGVGPGRPVLVDLRGVSGIGKSELIERFLAETGGRAVGGRCQPKESVPFKAIDPAVDELSRHLLAVGEADLRAVVPARCRPLLRLFPVLGRVAALAERAEAEAEPAIAPEPPELRRQAVQALRELLQRLAARAPLILWVDDAQWADRDSGPVLRELLRPPDAPALLVLVASRAEETRGSAFLDVLDEVVEAGDLPRRRIDLAPLAGDEAAALATDLLGQAGASGDPDAVRAVVEESEGSPFFLGELVRHVLRTGAGSAAHPPPALADVTRARLDTLTPEARSVAELVAVAGGPVDAAMVLGVAGLGAGGWPLVRRMCNQSLLREGGSRGEGPDLVESYHDRIRETLLASLSADDLRTRHAQLAGALEGRPDADPEALMRHFVGAGESLRAADYARLAAEQAAAALAFERAAELYEAAVELRGGRADDWPLHAARASALAAAGRGAVAGAVYEDAARHAESDGRPAEVTLGLSVDAAEQYFFAGLLVEGMRVLRGVLTALEVPVPSTPGAALRTALALRARFVLRGIGRTPPRRSEATPRERLRLDAMWRTARGIAMLDHTLADALAVRHLLAALDLGDPSRMVRALCMEAATEATVGGRWLRRRSERLVEWAARLAGETGEGYDEALVELHRGVLALLGARFADCVDHCRAAEEIYRARCTGIAHELNLVRSFHYGALALLGRIRELGELVTAHLEEARVRGDRYALAFFTSGDQVLVPLARGDAAAARTAVEASLAGVPDDHFTSLHFYHLLGSARIELYGSDGAAAWQRLSAAWPRLRASGFLGLEGLGTVLHYLNGCAALAAAAEGGLAQSASPAAPPSGVKGTPAVRRRDALRALRAAERFLRRVTIPTGAPLAAILRAGIHGLRGERPAQLATLREAIGAADGVGMALHRESLRLALGRISDGEEAAAATGAALVWMEREDIRDPFAMALSTAPMPLPEAGLAAGA